jgi:hypothetical protein
MGFSLFGQGVRVGGRHSKHRPTNRDRRTTGRAPRVEPAPGVPHRPFRLRLVWSNPGIPRRRVVV